MAFTEMDRTVIEVRELLAKTRNKDQVVRIMQTRGMDGEEAHEIVYSVYKGILSVNRKSALLGTICCGVGFVVFGAASIATVFLVPALVIIAGIVGLGFLWGAVKLCTANGYELDED